MRRSLLAIVFCALAGMAQAASIPLLTGPQDPSQLNATINGVIQQLNAQITPNSLAGFSASRNYIDNGAMAVAQRGTGIITCGTTTVPIISAYAADRWGCNANVGSGAGRMQVTTSTPTPPTGFTNSQRLYRTSGILTQPVCAWQEIPTANASQLASQSVVFSSYVQALAGMASDNGGAFNLVIVTGTGSDEGLQSFTASTAITPAFTGVATLQSTAFTATTAWARYAAPAVVVPSTVTEIAVGVCFTPTAAAVAGTTDGLAFTGTQLEQGLAASSFEFLPYATDLIKAQRYLFTVAESATSGAQQSPAGQGATTTTCQLTIPFVTTMRAAPTFFAAGTALSASTWTITHVATATALATTYLVVLGANTPNAGSLTATVASGLTTGQTCTLTSAAGGSIIAWSADF